MQTNNTIVDMAELFLGQNNYDHDDIFKSGLPKVQQSNSNRQDGDSNAQSADLLSADVATEALPTDMGNTARDQYGLRIKTAKVCHSWRHREVNSSILRAH